MTPFIPGAAVLRGAPFFAPAEQAPLPQGCNPVTIADITVKAGVPVRWNIHAEAEKITGCNNEMVIPALDLRIPLEPGDNIVEFTAEEPGVIPYTCWMGMLRGSITAVE